MVELILVSEVPNSFMLAVVPGVLLGVSIKVAVVVAIEGRQTFSVIDQAKLELA